MTSINLLNLAHPLAPQLRRAATTSARTAARSRTSIHRRAYASISMRWKRVIYHMPPRWCHRAEEREIHCGEEKRVRAVARVRARNEGDIW